MAPRLADREARGAEVEEGKHSHTKLAVLASEPRVRAPLAAASSLRAMARTTQHARQDERRAAQQAPPDEMAGFRSSPQVRHSHRVTCQNVKHTRRTTLRHPHSNGAQDALLHCGADLSFSSQAGSEPPSSATRPADSNTPHSPHPQLFTSATKSCPQLHPIKGRHAAPLTTIEVTCVLRLLRADAAPTAHLCALALQYARCCIVREVDAAPLRPILEDLITSGTAHELRPAPRMN